ncbi:MAG TPA: hypothetical protein V6D47_10150 [Oscillatoriaceae cyanobacterium]
MNRTFAIITVPVLVVALGGALRFGSPLPPVALKAASNQLTLPGTFHVNFPKEGQLAVGEESLGVVAASPNQEPVAIASLTKMMTAYLLLQSEPLKYGEDGPVTTLTAADVAEYQKDRAAGDSVVRVAAGEKMTERELLEALLLPSADNIATLIANKLAGSEDAFVTKMNAAAKSLGMNQTTYRDAAGVNPATVSTASDQLKIAQAVMQNRQFRDIVREPQAELPVAGIVYNVDFMVGKQGISGIKTGSTLEAGSCFVGSYPITVDGVPRIALAAVLGQQSLHDALTYDAQVLHDISSEFKNYPITQPTGGFASLVAPWDEQSGLQVTKPLQVFGYPGMPVTIAAKLVQEKLPITAGQNVAELTITAGTATETAPLQAVDAIQPPTAMWRLIR